MRVEIWDEDYTTMALELDLHNLKSQFQLSIEDGMSLIVDMQNMEVESVEAVDSDEINNTVVLSFVNYFL